MKVTFEISTETITEFAEIIEEFEIQNTITGTSEDSNILIDVTYSRNDREAIDILETLAVEE